VILPITDSLASMPSHRAQGPANLMGQAQWTGAAIFVALVLRRIDRLICNAQTSGVIDTAICRVKAVLTDSLDLNVGLLILGVLLGISLLGYLVVRLMRKAPVYIVDFTVHKPDPR